MDFLEELDKQLQDVAYRELTGINCAEEVYHEYKLVITEDNEVLTGTARPECSPKTLTPTV